MRQFKAAGRRQASEVSIDFQQQLLGFIVVTGGDQRIQFLHLDVQFLLDSQPASAELIGIRTRAMQ
jgi:hypothetical protein